MTLIFPTKYNNNITFSQENTSATILTCFLMWKYNNNISIKWYFSKNTRLLCTPFQLQYFNSIYLKYYICGGVYYST